MNENIEKNKYSTASRIFLGLFLCLLATILLVDIGYIGRTFTFVFTLLFGYGSYLFYALFFFFGVLIVFNPKKTKIHGRRYVPGIIFLLIGSTSLLSYFLNKDISLTDIVPKISELYQAENYYSAEWIRKIPFMYNSLVNGGATRSVSGGLIGDLGLAALNRANIDNLPIAIIFIVLSLGFIAVILPIIIPLFKKRAKKKKEKPVLKESSENIIIDNTNETIMQASKKPSISQSGANAALAGTNLEPSNYNEKESQGLLDFADTSAAPIGGLKKALYKNTDGDFGPLPTATLEPIGKITTNKIKVEKEIVNEQLSFDFESAENVDEMPISTKTEFIVPVEKKKVYIEAQSSEISNTPKKTRTKFIPPENSLLATYEVMDASSRNNLVAEQRKIKINEIFKDLKIGATCVSYVVGPAVTRFNISYDSAVSIRAVSVAFEDIQLRLGGVVGRFQSIVEGEPYSGMELPNAVVTMVGFKDVLESLPPFDVKPLSIAFGKDISGKIIFADLNDFPHLLISGTTGSGKSIFVHSILMTLIMRSNPDDLKIVLVDPKRVEMAMYANESHLLCPIITDANKAKVAMEKLDFEMERRYGILAKTGNTDMKTYREYCKEHEDAEWLPYIVVVLDEYADLADRAKDIQQYVVSIVQKARAAGIHVIISTQRPSTNVITGVIKGNLPTRVALTTSSAVDSITIIGEGGAEKLLGRGDMLVQSPLISRTGCVRLQGCYVSNREIVRVVEYLKNAYPAVFNPDFLDLVDHSKEPTTPGFSPLEEGSVGFDEKYELVKETVMQQEYSSISRIQREFNFGFSRAGKIFAMLQREGIVANAPETQGSSKGCRVLVHDSYYLNKSEVGSEELTEFEDDERKNR